MDSFRTVRDQMGLWVKVPSAPKRIVSLVPSQTELLFYLGLTHEVIGITKFCIYPDEAKKTSSIIGGTKKFNFHRIESLKPDLIIGNKEENYQEGIDQLKQNYPVWMSDITDLSEALNMIQQIGVITGKTSESQKLMKEIKTGFSTRPSGIFKAVYLIWDNPIMVAGKGTFIDEMLSLAGFDNAVELERYPTLNIEQLKSLNPDVILLSSEPFPFKQKHMDQFKKIFPYTKVLLVDGELFSWYGSRLLKSPKYFSQLQTLIRQ